MSLNINTIGAPLIGHRLKISKHEQPRLNEYRLPPSPSILYFPDYRQTNQYQELLYQEVDLDSQSGTLAKAIELCTPQEPVVWHLHWPEPLIRDYEARYGALAKSQYLGDCRDLKSRGGSVLMTVHNYDSHDSNWRPRTIDWQTTLEESCDAVLVHFEKHKSLLHARGRYLASPIWVQPHGPFPVAPSSALKEARSTRGRPFRIGVLGQIRDYKFPYTIASAFELSLKSRGDIELCFVGLADSTVKDRLEALVKPSTFSAITFTGELTDSDYWGKLDSLSAAVIVTPHALMSSNLVQCAQLGLPVVVADTPEMRCFDGMLPLIPVAWEGVADEAFVERLSVAMIAAVGGEEAIRSRIVGSNDLLTHGSSWSYSAAALLEAIGYLSEVKHPDDAVRVRRAGDQLVGSALISVISHGDPLGTAQTVLNIHRANPHATLAVLDTSIDELNVSILGQVLPASTWILDINVTLGYAAVINRMRKWAMDRGVATFYVSNPDIRWVVGEIPLQLPRGQVWGPMVLAPSGRVASFGMSLDGPLPVHCRSGDLPEEVPTDVIITEGLTGCFFGASTETWALLPDLPEEWHLYFEESEWFKDLIDNVQFTVVADANCAVKHLEASKPGGAPTISYAYYFVRNATVVMHRLGIIPHEVFKFMKDWQARMEGAPPILRQCLANVFDVAMRDAEAIVTGYVDVLARLLTSGAPVPRGYVESIENGVIRGWAYVYGPMETWPDQFAISLGSRLHAVRPDFHERADLVGLVSDDGFVRGVGFTVEVPSSLLAPGSVSVALWCNGAPLASAGGGVFKAKISRPYLPEFKPNKLLYVSVGVGHIEGWVCFDPSGPARTIELLESSGIVISRALLEPLSEELIAKGLALNGMAFRLLVPDAQLYASKSGWLRIVDDAGTLLHYEPFHYSGHLNLSINDSSLERAFNSSLQTALGTNPRLSKPFVQTQLRIKRDEIANRYRGDTSLAQVTVSVIMPFRNRASSLGEAIKSVALQSHSNVELILIDDASDDSSVTCAEEMLQRMALNGRLLRLPEQRGHSAARNIGLAHATGQFISFLDSDNRWHPDFLLVSLGAMKEQGLASAYSAQRVVMDVLGKEIEMGIRFARFSVSALRERNFIDLNSFIHERRKSATPIMFPEDMTRLTDWVYIQDVLECSTPVQIPLVLGEYRANAPDSVTQFESFTGNFWKSRRRILVQSGAESA